jgi:subtilisin family serine protease
MMMSLDVLKYTESNIFGLWYVLYTLLINNMDSSTKIISFFFFFFQRKFKPRLFTAHKISGVDVFRQKTGLDGTGIKVGIIDNGLDYTHPAFGNCFKTPGCKTQFGSDLVGVGTSANPKPDNDPLETCEGHGTHVAGIVAADDHELNFTGVAPGGKLLFIYTLYRMCSVI